MIPLLVATLAMTAPVAGADDMLSWAAFEKAHRLSCQVEFGAEASPVERGTEEQPFLVKGSRAVRAVKGKRQVKLGLLSAIKDVEEETHKNLWRAFEAFRRAGVEVVIANGDVALNEFDLEEVMQVLGKSGFPVLVLIGNSESRAAFNRAFVAAEAKYKNLINLNWVRHVDLGPVHLVSLPGYHDRGFMAQRSGCRYKPADVEAVGRYVDELRAAGKPVVLVAHGPPRSKGAKAIDRAFEAGNVGDPEVQRLVLERQIPYGLFGHILEAGGRGSEDLRLGKALKPGQRSKRLYVNAGSASSMPWGMLDGGTATGMAMIIELAPEGGSYKVVKLSP